MQGRDIKGGLRILGMAVCIAAVFAAPLVKSVYPRTAMLILGIINLVQLSIDEGRARERQRERPG